QMRAEIARIQRQLAVTTVYVTHDQVEAMTMGDRVAVLRRGVLQQFDAPQHLYANPANLFVASFIGSPAMNVVEANVERQDEGLVDGEEANDLAELIAEQDHALLVARIDPSERIREGDVIELTIDLRKLHFFDLESGATI